MAYLKLYNSISCAAWAVILAEDVWAKISGNGVYSMGHSEPWPHKLLVQVQTLNAIFELFHAISGLVPSPLSSLLLQFFARLVITLGISYYVPDSPGNYTVAYSVLILAWASTEIVRYSFYAAKQFGHVPSWLLWLRYSTFLLMYPLGLFSEPIVVYKTLGSVSGGYKVFLSAGMFLYIPGFFFSTHTCSGKEKSTWLAKVIESAKESTFRFECYGLCNSHY